MIAFAQLQGVSLYFISCFNYDISRQSQFLGVFLSSVENAREGAIDPKNYLIRP